MNREDMERILNTTKEHLFTKHTLHDGRTLIGGKVRKRKKKGKDQEHCIHHTWSEDKQCLVLVSGKPPKDNFVPFDYKTRTVIGRCEANK